jgi:hypothetical protein
MGHETCNGEVIDGFKIFAAKPEELTNNQRILLKFILHGHDLKM